MSEDTKLINRKFGRRTFLKATGAMGAAVALSGAHSTLVQKNVAKAAAAEEVVIPTQCGVCPGNCGVNAYVKEGRLVRVDALQGHPQGFLCVRGNATVQHVYSPDRIKYPMKRMGERGDGKFQRITWDEAIETIAGKLKEIKDKYGPQAVGGGGSRGLFGPGIRVGEVANRFFAAFGSPNYGSTSNSFCQFSYGVAAPTTTMGQATQYGFKNSKAILLWGAEPSNDSPPIMGDILDAKQNGAKLLVIDPQFGDSAAKANMWIGPRPGSDGALALAFLNVIINEGLYDHDFVANWTVGFDDLKQYVQDFTPEKVADLTWVPADKIYAMARAIATTKPLCLVVHTGLEYSTSGVQAIRAAMIIHGITGNIDVAGGNLFAMPGLKTNPFGVVKPPAQPEPIGREKYPFFVDYRKQGRSLSWPQAILEGKPYPLRALILAGTSTLTQAANARLHEKAFKALDFLVVMDRFMINDALLADIALPAATYYEQIAYATYPGLIQLREKVIEPVGEAWSDLKFWITLGQKVGLTAEFPWKTEEEFWNYVLEPSGFTVAKLRENLAGIPIKGTPMQYKKYEKGLLRKDGKPGFDTPSGKFEIRSALLEKYGYDGLPIFREPEVSPFSTPDVAKKYPLIFTSGTRIHTAFHSQHRSLPWLIEIQAGPLVVMNTKDAAARGIKNGDAVIVEAPKGTMPAKAKVTERIIPGAVEVSHGGGNKHAAPAWRDGNVNLITDDTYCDPISGFPIVKALLCEVRKA